MNLELFLRCRGEPGLRMRIIYLDASEKRGLSLNGKPHYVISGEVRAMKRLGEKGGAFF